MSDLVLSTAQVEMKRARSAIGALRIVQTACILVIALVIVSPLLMLFVASLKDDRFQILADMGSFQGHGAGPLAGPALSPDHAHRSPGRPAGTRAPARPQEDVEPDEERDARADLEHVEGGDVVRVAKGEVSVPRGDERCDQGEDSDQRAGGDQAPPGGVFCGDVEGGPGGRHGREA